MPLEVVPVFSRRKFYFHFVLLRGLVMGRPPFFPLSREAFALRLLLMEPRATAAGFLGEVFID